MFAICDPSWTLAQAFSVKLPLERALVYFLKTFPNVNQAVVYRDLRERGDPRDFQFLFMLNAKQLKSWRISHPSLY